MLGRAALWGYGHVLGGHGEQARALLLVCTGITRISPWLGAGGGGWKGVAGAGSAAGAAGRGRRSP